MSDQNTSLPLEFPTGAPARKETMSSLVVTHKALIADLETLNDPFHGVPVNAVRASLTVNPTGANNSIDYTAVAYGADGNAVSVAYTAPVQGELEVSVADSAITVACGTKHRMVITGTFSPDVTRTLVYAGQSDGEPTMNLWTSDGELTYPESGSWTKAEIVAEGGSCQLIHYTAGGIDGSWTSTETDADYPDGLTYVADGNHAETGTPVVTAALPTAQQVIDAVEASEEATALVTVAANGTVTGAVAAVAAANLSGGVDGTPGKRGQLANDETSIWYCMTTDLTAQNHGWIELAQAT